jgi:hypothetical protein
MGMDVSKLLVCPFSSWDDVPIHHRFWCLHGLHDMKYSFSTVFGVSAVCMVHCPIHHSSLSTWHDVSIFHSSWCVHCLHDMMFPSFKLTVTFALTFHIMRCPMFQTPQFLVGPLSIWYIVPSAIVFWCVHWALNAFSHPPQFLLCPLSTCSYVSKLHTSKSSSLHDMMFSSSTVSGVSTVRIDMTWHDMVFPSSTVYDVSTLYMMICSHPPAICVCPHFIICCSIQTVTKCKFWKYMDSTKTSLKP